jgi:hypothetical protein
MIYSFDFAIPANTSFYDPKHNILPISKGLVYRVEFQFPYGVAGLAHVQVYDGGHQVWPSHPHNDFTGNNNTIAFDDLLLKSQPPFQLDLFGWNDDDTYQHTIYVRVGVVTQQVFMARFMPTITYDYFLEVLKRLEIEERERMAARLKSPFSWITPEEEEEED